MSTKALLSVAVFLAILPVVYAACSEYLPLGTVGCEPCNVGGPGCLSGSCVDGVCCLLADQTGCSSDSHCCGSLICSGGTCRDCANMCGNGVCDTNCREDCETCPADCSYSGSGPNPCMSSPTYPFVCPDGLSPISQGCTFPPYSEDTYFYSCKDSTTKQISYFDLKDGTGCECCSCSVDPYGGGACIGNYQQPWIICGREESCSYECLYGACITSASAACSVGPICEGTNYNYGCGECERVYTQDVSQIYGDHYRWQCEGEVTGSTCQSCDKSIDGGANSDIYEECYHSTSTGNIEFVTSKGTALDDEEYNTIICTDPVTPEDGYCVGTHTGDDGNTYSICANNVFCGATVFVDSLSDPGSAIIPMTSASTCSFSHYVVPTSGWNVRENVKADTCTTTKSIGLSSSGYFVPVCDEGLVYSNLQSGEIDYTSGDGRYYLPVPMVQPACYDTSCYSQLSTICPKNALEVAAYCFSPDCKSPVHGGDVQGVAYDYADVINLNMETCPNNVLENDFAGEDEEFHTYLKSFCFYGESCGSTYTSPMWTNEIYDSSGELLCICDGFNEANDCSAGYCTDTSRGTYSTDIDCTAIGWTAGYYEARVREVGVFNSAGDYKQYYDCDSGTRQTPYSVCSARGGSVGFDQKSDRVTIEVAVENTGTKDITEPFIMVTHGGLDINIDVGFSGFTELKSIGDDSVCELIDGALSCGSGIDSFPMFRGGNVLGIWLKNSDAVVRSANMELISESSEWDNKLEPSEKMVFTVSMPAYEWDRTIELYFYELDISLTDPALGSANPRDYLARFDFTGNFDSVSVRDLAFTDVGVSKLMTTILPYDLCDRCGGSCTCDVCETSYSTCDTGETCDGYGNCITAGGPITFLPFAIAPFRAAATTSTGTCPAGYTFNPASCECETQYSLSCEAGYNRVGCGCEPYVSSIASETELSFSGTLSPESHYMIDCNDYNYMNGLPWSCAASGDTFICRDSSGNPDLTKSCDSGYTATGCDGSMLVCERQDTLTCTDCLYCFASRLDSDSFDVVWTSNRKSDPSAATQNFYPFITGVTSWTGYYFLPRAYAITLDANLEIVRGESAVSSTFDDSFSAVAAAYSSRTELDSFMLSYPNIAAGGSCESTTLSSDYIFGLETTEEPLSFKLLERQAYSPPLFNMTMNFDGELYDIDVDGRLELGSVSAGLHSVVLFGSDQGQRLADYSIMLFHMSDPQDAVCGACNPGGAGSCAVIDGIGRCLNSSGMQCLDDGIQVTPTCGEGLQLSGCTCQRVVNLTANITNADGEATINIDNVFDTAVAVIRKVGGTVPVSGASIQLYSVSTLVGSEEPACSAGTLDATECECKSMLDAFCGPGEICADDGRCYFKTVDMGAPECLSGELLPGTCGCEITTSPACGAGYTLQGCECVPLSMNTLSATTDSDGIARFDLGDSLDNLFSASAFVFDSSGNFASAMDLDVTWKIDCLSGCETTGSEVSPALRIMRSGQPFEGSLKVIEYTCVPPNCGALTQEDTTYTISGGDDGNVTLTGTGRFENMLGGTTSNPISKKFMLEFYGTAPEDATLLMGTTLDVYYDNTLDKTYITNDPILVTDTTTTGTFVGKDTCNVQSSVKIPRELTVTAPECDSIVVYSGLERIPHQLLPSADNRCRILIVPETSMTSVDVYYGTGFPEFNYDTSWGSIAEDSGDYVVRNGMIDAKYELSCWEKGPCIISLTTTPDNSPEGNGWVGNGLMWDSAESIDQEVDLTVDGPLKKCMRITYRSSAPYTVSCPDCPANDIPTKEGFRFQTVSRDVCMYKGVPAIFEEFNLLDVYPEGQPPVEHTFVQSGYPTALQIYSLDSLFWQGYPADGTGSGIASDRAVWGDRFGVLYNTSSEFSYVVDLRDTVSSDAYLSDLWTSFKEIYAQIPDSIDLSPDAEELLDFETIATCTPDKYDCTSAAIDNDGSMRYYAPAWLQSGTSGNCDDDRSENYDNVFGTTCGGNTSRGTLELSLGIQRTGSHLLKFSTVEELAELGGSPDIKLLNSMGGEARVVEPFRCGITDNVFSCTMDKDEKDVALNLDRQGYVISCMVDEGSYRALNTRYFNPYMMPMSWEVQFDILVNPYIEQPVPIFVEERGNSLAATTCGDWICQSSERCYTCPADCPPLDVQFEPVLTTGG